MITIKRFNGSEGPLFIGPCIITEESDTLLCAMIDGLWHLFISERHGDGRTEIS